MDVKFTIIRTTGQGEQTQAEVELGVSKRELSRLHDIYEVMDERCFNRNTYLIAGMRFMKKLPIEAQMGVKECINILYGQSEYSEVVEQVIKEQEAYKSYLAELQAADEKFLAEGGKDE